MTNPLKTVITNTDMFCGCGGSSQGARDAGIEVVMAGNHWERAIETHQTNFPDTDHDKADIEEIDPRRWPRTTTLWASPGYCNPAGSELTITAQDHHALVVPMPFLTSYYTHGDGRPIDEPMATIPTLHKHALVIPDTIPALEDCLFRMLKPPEIGLGMGFAPTYVVLGNQREQVRQYGNAVTPPASRWLWRQVAEIFK